MEELFRLVPEALLDQSGRVAYSGRKAFSGKAPVYLLGLNPGGDPQKLKSETIRADMAQTLAQPSEHWSAYVDDEWESAPAGSWGLQPRVQHLCRALRLDPKVTPSSNLIFLRTRRESALGPERMTWARQCWPFHQAVIEATDPCLIICFGKTAGKIALEMLGKGPEVARFVEQNNRRWVSTVHQSESGRFVATMTHPSIAAWNVPATDPSGILKSFIRPT